MSIVACQRDAYLQELTTEVQSCTKTNDYWDVILEDTVLYPEGGGQPSDRGRINESNVLHVRREPSGQVIHQVDTPVPVGPAHAVVDWPRRFDHMQQHTAQHLITALIQDQMGYETLAFHLSEKRCDIELDVPDLEPSQLKVIETIANEAIRQSRDVTYRLVDAADMNQMPVRTRGLPDNLDGPIRLVEIAGLDLNTCGGTHVSTTAELQAIKVLGTERVRGRTRLFYWAGQRVIDGLCLALEREKRITQALSVGPNDHLDAIERLTVENKNAAKTTQALLDDLAALYGADLNRKPSNIGVLHCENVDLNFLNAVAKFARTDRPEMMVLLTTGDRDGEGMFLLVGPSERVTTVKPLLAELLGARGGGPPGRFQGKASQLNKLESAYKLLATHE